MSIMDEIAKQQGFTGEEELHHLVSTVLLNTPERLSAFERWKTEDGTKIGLLALDHSQIRRI